MATPEQLMEVLNLAQVKQNGEGRYSKVHLMDRFKAYGLREHETAMVLDHLVSQKLLVK